VYSRVEALTDPRGMVGFSFQATKDAFYGQYAPGHLLLLTYERLARNPSAAMRAVYQFIGEPWFEHDFDHISLKLPVGRSHRRSGPTIQLLAAGMLNKYRHASITSMPLGMSRAGVSCTTNMRFARGIRPAAHSSPPISLSYTSGRSM
jgi:hypothetical protein